MAQDWVRSRPTFAGLPGACQGQCGGIGAGRYRLCLSTARLGGGTPGTQPPIRLVRVVNMTAAAGGTRTTPTQHRQCMQAACSAGT